MTTDNGEMPLLNSSIEKWAKETPNHVAMIETKNGEMVTYQNFQNLIEEYALSLLDLGIKQGDRVATMLLTSTEHLILMYACFKIGAIIAPLDIRLKENEVVQDIEKIKPKAFFYLGCTETRDYRGIARKVMEDNPYVQYFIQFDPFHKREHMVPGAIPFFEFIDRQKVQFLKIRNQSTRELEEISRRVDKRTPAMIIFTTGTTGGPKPALLCHENIILVNEIISRGYNLKNEEYRFIVNLPPSHVAGTCIGPMTTFYNGGTAILLEIFDPKLTLDAIRRYNATCLFMIATQYRLIWSLPQYKDSDLQSLKCCFFGGALVDTLFLKEISKMAPRFFTGFGMTENAGCALITPDGLSIEDMFGQVGSAFPDTTKVTIRKPMKENGEAGEELPDGEAGEICYHPPAVFLGYYGQPEETAKTVSKEGILYSGDLGYFKNVGSNRALYLNGRRKFMIKQKGYNVFPDEVMNHINLHPKVAQSDVIGLPHHLFDEGIFVFVQSKAGMTVTEEEIIEHCNHLASYKRPQHVEIWPVDKPFPLTRVGKVDKVQLKNMAINIVEELINQGKWDRMN